MAISTATSTISAMIQKSVVMVPVLLVPIAWSQPVHLRLNCAESPPSAARFAPVRPAERSDMRKSAARAACSVPLNRLQPPRGGDLGRQAAIGGAGVRALTRMPRPAQVQRRAMTQARRPQPAVRLARLFRSQSPPIDEARNIVPAQRRSGSHLGQRRRPGWVRRCAPRHDGSPWCQLFGTSASARCRGASSVRASTVAGSSPPASGNSARASIPFGSAAAAASSAAGSARSAR
jgi:hypothetical protein